MFFNCFKEVLVKGNKSILSFPEGMDFAIDIPNNLLL